MDIKTYALCILAVLSCSHANSLTPGEMTRCRTSSGKDGACVPKGLCLGESVTGGCSEDNVCCELPNENPSTVSSPKQGCGWRNTNGTAHTAAYVGEFPWIVYIYKDIVGFETTKGAGSLIHPRVVITGALSINDDGGFFVRVGQYDLRNDDNSQLETINVKSYKKPDDYRSATSTNMVALLFLEKDVQGPNVGYICLPPPVSTIPAGFNCISTVWRYRGYLRDYPSLIMSIEENKTVKRDYCSAQFGAAGYTDELGPSQMCAGEELYGESSSGEAPLYCPYLGIEGRYFEAGVSAWARSSEHVKIPRQYTDVSYLRTWIDQTMVKNGLTTNYYTV